MGIWGPNSKQQKPCWRLPLFEFAFSGPALAIAVEACVSGRGGHHHGSPSYSSQAGMLMIIEAEGTEGSRRRASRDQHSKLKDKMSPHVQAGRILWTSADDTTTPTEPYVP